MVTEPKRNTKKQDWAAGPLPLPPQNPPRRPPMARRGPRAVRQAKDFGERRPMTAAVLATTFVVTLMCFYVAAYARVTAEGFELSRLRVDLRTEAMREDAFRAEISRLTLPDAVARRAQALGMTPAAPESLEVVAPVSPAPTAEPKTTGE